MENTAHWQSVEGKPEFWRSGSRGRGATKHEKLCSSPVLALDLLLCSVGRRKKGNSSREHAMSREKRIHSARLF